MKLNDLNPRPKLDPNLITAIPPTGPGFKIAVSETGENEALVIPLSSIWVDPIKNNTARYGGKNESHVQKLATSLSNECKYDCKPPVVQRRVQIIDGILYEYELLDGFHRFEAFLKSDITEWIFWVYELGLNGHSLSDSQFLLTSAFNDHAISLPSSIDDISQSICDLIRNNSKLVENDEESIRSFVNKTYKNLHNSTKSAVINCVISNAGTDRRYITYTSRDTINWIERNTDFTHSGKFDKKRSMHGWNVLESYEYEFVHMAMKKFGEGKNESYFVFRTKTPSESRTLDDRRKDMISELKKLESDLLDTFEFYSKNKRFPWSVAGFLPQESRKENKFIPLKEFEKNFKPKVDSFDLFK